jgi:L,D-transpeptidase-like protein
MNWRPPAFLLLIASMLLGSGCTELPNDIGVHRHRSSAVLTRAASRHPVFASWNDDPTATGPRRIVVNLTTQQAFFYRGETLIGKTNISSGKREFETPPGKYRVIQKDAKHVSSQYGVYENRLGGVVQRDVDVNQDPRPEGAHFVGAPMPYFLRFRDGYGMHAGFVPRYRASHGCVRMPIRMAKHFFDAAEIGTRVEVIEPGIPVAPSTRSASVSSSGDQ